ncbi:MAG TPA: SRPBCC family protein [Candidatus Saccharimonadales bacterium]|nr:SRPBCC family protein [Candidatus Saccharimonadales bacterium]
MKIREFKTELWLPVGPSELFPFFADAGNLESITPGWLHFKTLTAVPIEMKAGTLIDYRLRVHGLPLRWRTLISTWEPPHRFVDEQIRGPYRQWIHEHTFEARGGGTLTRDRVRYAVPLDFLIHDWVVRPDIERIFLFRSTALKNHFSRSHQIP